MANSDLDLLLAYPLHPLKPRRPPMLHPQESGECSTFFHCMILLVNGNYKIVTQCSFGCFVIDTRNTRGNGFELKATGRYFLLKNLNEFWSLSEFIKSVLNPGFAISRDFLHQFCLIHKQSCSRILVATKLIDHVRAQRGSTLNDA